MHDGRYTYVPPHLRDQPSMPPPTPSVASTPRQHKPQGDPPRNHHLPSPHSDHRPSVSWAVATASDRRCSLLPGTSHVVSAHELTTIIPELGHTSQYVPPHLRHTPSPVLPQFHSPHIRPPGEDPLQPLTTTTRPSRATTSTPPVVHHTWPRQLIQQSTGYSVAPPATTPTRQDARSIASPTTQQSPPACRKFFGFDRLITPSRRLAAAKIVRWYRRHLFSSLI